MNYLIILLIYSIKLKKEISINNLYYINFRIKKTYVPIRLEN